MSVTEAIPGMQPGQTARNLVLAVVYIIASPLIILLFPLIMGVLVGTNHREWAQRLDRLPGISSDGGVAAGVIVAVYAFVLLTLLGGILSMTEDPDDSGQSVDVTPTATQAGATPTTTLAESSTTATDAGQTATVGSTSTASPTPTAEPTPTPTPEPELTTLQSIREVDDRYDPARQKFSASGDTVTDSFTLDGGAMVLVYEHSGDSNFIVEVIDEETGKTVDVPINEIGEASGAAAIPNDGGDYRLDITADGEWSVEVAVPIPEEDDIERLPVEASGSGSDVLGPVELGDRTIVSATHDGESNFVVRVLDELAVDSLGSDILVNEVGEYDGESTTQYDGVVWVVVQADGNWTLEME